MWLKYLRWEIALHHQVSPIYTRVLNSRRGRQKDARKRERRKALESGKDWTSLTGFGVGRSGL
jgi:hypothetical protein